MSPLSAMPLAEADAPPAKLIPFQIKVTTEDGAKHRYAGLFPSTCDAHEDARNRFGFAKIDAKPCPMERP